MGFADVWNKTLVYFGIAEEEEWDEDGYLTDEDLQRAYAERPNVRRLAPRRRSREEFDDWTDPEPASARTSVLRPAPEPRRLRGVESMPSAMPSVPKVHLVLPRSFNDAQQIADRFKDGVPVILNLQGCDQELSKRLIDFASGLTYALDGGMQRVADKVFLLTPRNVEVSAEERACSSAAASSTRRRPGVPGPASKGGPMGGTATVTLLADAIDSAKSFIWAFTVVYTLVIFAYILTSWVRMPYSPWLNRIQRFLYDVSEPYLRLFRRILPSMGPLDLSPWVATIVLWLLAGVVMRILDQFH